MVKAQAATKKSDYFPCRFFPPTVPARTAENELVAAWEHTLARFGNRRAVLAASGVVLRTFSDIEAESRDQETLVEHLAPSSIVAIRLANHACWPALLLALFRRGHIPLPLGEHVGGGELSGALETCRVNALIQADGDALRVSRQSSTGTLQFPDADFLKLTSGTTSAPRAIRFRTAQLLADCESICTTMGLTDDDLNFGAIPFSHSYGFSNLITPLLCLGVPLVATDERLPRAILDGLAATGATVLPGIPVFFQNLAELGNARVLPRLRLCISAGAPLAPHVGEGFTARYGLKIHAFYGASESGGIAYDSRPEPHYEGGFVGTAMSGVTISPLEDGRISVHSAAVGDGYFPDNNEALRDGRFVPGDLVESTAHGLNIVGRTSDFINIAGRKLSPALVEQCLLKHPGVRQAVLFAVPSPLRGEEAVACVSGDSLDATSVLRFCQEHLTPWQVPRDIWIVPEIATNDRGKVSRRQIAARYLERRTKAERC